MPKVQHIIGRSPEAMVPVTDFNDRPWRKLIGSIETGLGWYNYEPFLSSRHGSEFTNLINGVPETWVKTTTNEWIEVA